MRENLDDLVVFTSPIAEKLPKDENDEGFGFTGFTLTQLPDTLESRSIVIKRGLINYNGSWRTDSLQVYATKDEYEALGIIAACVLLSPKNDRLEIRLTHPQSDIRSLVIEFPHVKVDEGYPHGLYLTPTLFEYYAMSVKRYPWLDDRVFDPRGFPLFELSNQERCPITDDDWRNRDVIYGFGSADGTARLVQLFLDMSRPGCNVSEFALESDAGFRGVAPSSSEIRFWLPGGDGWMDF
ncbi:MAG: hypothetical protein KA099_10290 [Alphaproteobacteria bacterium]|nr:hypothetical protein [Alphaproteobacteria bacterium]MBP7757985.1 hypothetical protein [Alphaproteobacteria bacterium]MBP7761312.1 hypothetical protein [Alphaproteobacteria bacterium]MBP7905703.1 hypothetical protein [Alphaproteobacteria bacterium]